MRKNTIRQLLIYSLGFILILTLGVRAYSAFPSSGKSESSPASDSQELQQPPLQISSSSLLPFATLSPSEAPPDDTVVVSRDIAKNGSNEVRISAAAESPSTYEVTAYYLNVRANAYNTSKVIKVIPRGTRLDIVKQTDNGWLRIKSGGYVHAEYARLVEGADVNLPEKAKLTALVEPIPNKRPTQSLKSVPVGALKNPTPVKPLSVQQAGDGEEDPVEPTSKVRTDSGLSEDDLERIFDGTALAGHGLEETVLEVEEQYGINALFTIAVMKLESGNGTSRIARSKNNLFGLNAITGDAHNRAFSFETKGDSVRKFGQLLSKNYVGKGYTTIEKIATKYCPANSKWSGLVKNIMKKDFQKVNA